MLQELKVPLLTKIYYIVYINNIIKNIISECLHLNVRMMIWDLQTILKPDY